MSVYLKQEQGWESRTIFTAPGSAALRAATKSGSRLRKLYILNSLYNYVYSFVYHTKVYIERFVNDIMLKYIYKLFDKYNVKFPLFLLK